MDKSEFIKVIKRVVICTLSVVLLGISIALNTRAMLGNDPITVFYDGLSIQTGHSMGITANIINSILLVIVLLVDRHYINIGTLIYAEVLGPSITLGLNLYNLLNIPEILVCRIVLAVIGYSLAFVSLGAFVAVDIGIDPWTASAIIMSQKLNKSFGGTKVSIDAIALLIGYFLGGTVGVMTFISAIIGGPAIEKISEFLDKLFSRVIKYSG